MNSLGSSAVSLAARWLRRVRNRHFAAIDLCLLPLAAVLAFAVRLDTLDLRPYALPVCGYAIASLLIKMPMLALLGIYTRLWECAGVYEASLLILGTAAGALLQGVAFRLVLAPAGIVAPIPLSVPFIDMLLSIMTVAGPRFLMRVGLQQALRRLKARQLRGPTRRVLIAGAGRTGQLVLCELDANPQTGMVTVGFVDDDPLKQGINVLGRRVLGPLAAIGDLVARYRVDEVIIAVPGAPGRTVRGIVETCTRAGIAVRIIPGVDELLSGRVTLQKLRPVRIEDLLRRDPVQTDTEQVRTLISGRRVLITGGGGSIGSELSRQVAGFGPSELVLLGHGENSIFNIANELRSLRTAGAITCEVHAVIADMRDKERLAGVFERFQPEIVFHAAAHKHVPLMESNVEDAISNNVSGTRTLLNTCIRFGVTHFVLISSDKAVNPSSVMGATKRVAELEVQQAALCTGRCYVAVRFGNVLGSRGSVIPLFEKQIADGGPITVTHPDIRRYFMTIPEAVQLVLQAAALGCGGEVFVLDMGQPVRIADLAADLIRLSGLEPGRDIEIVYSGLRPGEKLFEEIFTDAETHVRTQHEKIFVCRNGASPEHVPPDLDRQLDQIIAAAQRGHATEALQMLQHLVPEYNPPDRPFFTPLRRQPAAGQQANRG